MFKEVVNLNKRLHKTNEWFQDKVLNFAIPTGGDPVPNLGQLTPPRSPNFRPETSGLMVIALNTTTTPQYLMVHNLPASKPPQSSNVHI